MKQIPLALTPDGQPSFETFIAADNAAAVDHLRNLAWPQAPVYLWGETGSGKTHLLQAMAHRVQSAGPQIGWFAAGSALPWTVLPRWAMVVIDDCQALDIAEQQAAFALFIEAASLGIQVLSAGRLPPIDLLLREDLRTRLAWGHVFAMHSLSEEQTRAALRLEADRRGIFLSDDVMDFLLTRFARDLKYLMALLDGLDEFALSTSRHVTVPLLKQMLAESNLGRSKQGSSGLSTTCG